jgi:hypothetical protein
MQGADLARTRDARPHPQRLVPQIAVGLPW